MNDGIHHRMFEVHHRTQHLWQAQPRWNFILRHDNLPRSVQACVNLLRPFLGQDVWNAEDMRIAEYDKKSRLVAIYDHTGELVETFTAPLLKRKVVKTKVAVTA